MATYQNLETSLSSLSLSPLDIPEQLPVSLLTSPVGPPKSRFNQFNLEYSRLLNDDYVHKKFLTLKYTGRGEFFSFASKGTLDFKQGANKRETPVTSSEVKFLTNIEGRSVEAKFDNKGGIRFWSNFGLYNIWKPIVLTAKVKTNSSLDEASANLSFEHQTRLLNVQMRLGFKNGGTPFLNNKVVFNDGKIQLGYAAKLNLLAYSLARYNLYFGYKEKDLQLFVEHTSRNKAKIEMGKVLFGGIYKRDGNDYVAKITYRPHKQEYVKVNIGTVFNINNRNTIRAKINNKAKLTFSSKFRYNSNLIVVVGTRIDLINPRSFFTDKIVPIPLGLNVELSYN